MKADAFVNLLSNHFSGDAKDAPMNNGYPVLLSEVGQGVPEDKSTAKVSFKVTAGDQVIENPQITLLARDGKEGIAAKNGQYELAAGEYLYRVVVLGYERICGSFLVDQQNQGDITIELTLTPCDEGTKWNPHQITTADQLQKLAKAVNAGTSYDGEYFMLMNDLDLSGIDWQPIGRSYNVGFRGHFDGGSHEIKNLTVKDYRYAGLFGYLSLGGTLENIFVIDGNVSGKECVGGIVGYNGNYPYNDYYSAITNCYYSGKVSGIFSGGSDHEFYFAGGIAGGSISGIKRCGVDADITMAGNGTAVYAAGGIAGLFLGRNDNYDSTPYNLSLGIVQDCWYVGDISCNKKVSRIGGIVGTTFNNNWCTVKRCYSAGTIDSAGEKGTKQAYGIAPEINADCIALQQTIDCWNDPSRTTPSTLLGRVGKTRNTNCYGYQGMTINNKKVTSAEGNSAAGMDVTANAVLSDVAYLNAGWSKDVWSFVNGYLPAIKGMPGPKVSRYSYLRAKTKYFAVSFDTNGGSDVADIVMLTGTIEEPAAPTREGYTFGGWYSDKECTVPFDFEDLITKNTTIYAKWEKVENTDPTPNPTPDEPTPDPAPELSFEDVQKGDWFYDDVMNVSQRGIVKGVADNLFAPNNKLSRGMIVTMLYRLDGEPAVPGDAAFTDVPSDQWYAKAVAWAHQNKIAQGYEDGTFLPNKNISRSELAAFLYRYGQYKEYDTTAKAELSTYEDGSGVADWAKDALSWAIGSGLIKGRTETTIVPQGEATRAEAATIFSRMLKQMEG